ncbi:MAG TPA: hypothetical protein VGN12_16890 [Pirellulales bacterium]|jgi:hypothetical protein
MALQGPFDTVPTWRHGFVIVSTTPVQLSPHEDWELFIGLTIKPISRGDYDNTLVWVGQSPGVTAGLDTDSDGILLSTTGSARYTSLTLPIRKASSLWLVTGTVLDNGECRPAQVFVEWHGA